MGANIEELKAMMAKKDARIRELELENMSLRSQLDKYQSIQSLQPAGIWNEIYNDWSSQRCWYLSSYPTP
jgi:cell shape-determining protein MreC